MTHKLPLISVLVCNYNYGQFIQETLDSVLKQKYQHIEIIIIDDGSKDTSVEIVRQFIIDNPNYPIKLKAKRTNQGLCYARNDALAMANGEYIVFLDSDDTMPPDYIANMYAIASEKKVDVVYGDTKAFGAANDQTNQPTFNQEELLLHNYINISSLVKKARIGEHRFDTALNRKTLEDYDFWLGLSLMGLQFQKAQGVYLNYRIQEASRNDNTKSLEQRILEFVDVWQYCINKYRKDFSDKISDHVEIKELRYQINKIAGELNGLNATVQNKLIPELRHRDEHITTREGQIKDLETHIHYLDGQIADRDAQIASLLNKSLRRKVSRALSSVRSAKKPSH